MNSDISWNSRVDNQALLHKGKIHRNLNSIAAKLKLDHLEPEKPDAQLSENNNWLASLANKIEALDNAIV